jgi:hypothetical protein
MTAYQLLTIAQRIKSSIIFARLSFKYCNKPPINVSRYIFPMV